MYFRYFVIISLGKGQGPSFEQTWIPFTKGCFVPSLDEISSVVLEKKNFKFLKCIFSICNYLPLEKDGALHLNKLESPSPKDALCQVWLKFAQWFWRRRWRTTDKFCSEKLSWAKKQEAHGPYPPEKPNTFEKSYDYITTWIRRGKIPLSPFKELNGPYL